MELTARQKKNLAAAARRIERAEIGPPEKEDYGRRYWEALKPIIRDAVKEAAPEIAEDHAANLCAPSLIWAAANYLAYCYDEREKADKAKKKAIVKKAAQKKAKAGTELDLFRKAAAKAEKPAQKKAPLPGTGKVKTKKTGKAVKRAAAILIGAAALIFSAGIAAAQCPGGNCQAAAGYYYPAWSGWYWPGFYYGYQQQPRANCPGGNCPAQKNAQEATETPADAPEFNPDEIPEWEPESAEGAAEGQETAPADEPAEEHDAQADPTADELRAAITPPPCPLAALAIRAVNDARRARGLAELIPDENLSAACERHSAYMKARGFQHAADGGRECIAENFATPAATVSAWLNSPSHAAIILGAGTRIGIGVVGRFYTLRIR